jgi:hypothetical protein
MAPNNETAAVCDEVVSRVVSHTFVGLFSKSEHFIYRAKTKRTTFADGS